MFLPLPGVRYTVLISYDSSLDSYEILLATAQGDLLTSSTFLTRANQTTGNGKSLAGAAVQWDSNASGMWFQTDIVHHSVHWAILLTHLKSYFPYATMHPSCNYLLVSFEAL